MLLRNQLHHLATRIPWTSPLTRNVVKVDIDSGRDVYGALTAASDPDTPYTIVLMMGDVQIKVSNSVAPGMLAMIFQLLKEQPC